MAKFQIKGHFFACILIFLLYKTNRFHVAVRLFSNRSQRTSKCGKNISDTLGCASCATFLFLPHFDVICDLLLNRRTATWNLFVNYDIKKLYSSSEGLLGKVRFFFPSLFYLVLFPRRWLQSPRGPHGNLVKR